LLPALEGANYEAGIKGALRDGALNFSFALFQIDQTNRAQNDPANPFPCLGSPTRTCSVASGEVRSKGFETEVAGRILPNLDLFAGYTYNSTEYLKDSTDTGAPSLNQGSPFSTFTPKHLLRVWAQYDLSVLDRRLRLGTGITAQSSFYATSGTSRLEQGGYALWNASASYALTQDWTVSLNGNNLLDKRYFDQLSNPNYANYYGEPRNVTLRVRAQF
jgi:outer membrane receptor for ferric coprogen and ferric-rhodotorulic acid